MARHLHSSVVLVSALGLGLLASPAALAFDWNARTGSFETEFGNTGYFTPASGHTLATACGIDDAAGRAANDPALASALARTLGTDVPKSFHDVARSEPYELLTFGDWGNEIFTNIGLEGRATHADAGEFLKGRYHDWLNADGAKAVYLDAKDGDGYASTYYLHSQALEGATQDQSFDAIKKHVKDALTASITRLEEADKKNVALPAFDNAFHGFKPKDCNARCQGLMFLGSVFHIIEDSSVSCSDAAKKALADKGQGSCEMGDGHTVVDWTGAGKPQVVTLSDDTFYQTRGDVHGHLDGLYTSCDTDHYLYSSADGHTFDFNPKLVTGRVLSEVARAVAAGEAPDAAADRIWRDVVSQRFAAPADRKPMPPVPPATGNAIGGVVGGVDKVVGMAPWQPVTNKFWYVLGRFVGWTNSQPPATNTSVGENSDAFGGTNTPPGPTGWNEYRNSDTNVYSSDDGAIAHGTTGGAGVPH